MSMFPKYLVSLCIASLIGIVALTPPGWCDRINLYNGHVIHAKINEIVGDLIVYNASVGDSGSVNRLEITNRQDVVRLFNGIKYLGEIIYLDNLKVEIRTPTGRKKVWRLWVKELVLGTPLNQPETDYIESPRQRRDGPKALVLPTGSGGLGPVLRMPSER